MEEEKAYQRVEFKTFDGVTLRGDLYLPMKENAPLVIMTHGVSLRLTILIQSSCQC